MCSPSKIQPTVGAALKNISKANKLDHELFCYSHQNDLSDASWESNPSINVPQRIGSLQTDEVSPSNKLCTPLFTENPAPGKSQANPVLVLTPSSNLFTLDDELDSSYGRLSPMFSNGILAGNSSTNRDTVTIQRKDIKRCPTQVDECLPTEFEWQDLMAFLDAEKERMRALHSMSPMERFLTYDRDESPLVGLREAADKGYPTDEA